MSYSLNLLTTTADCDAMIAIAQKEKGELAYRKITLERQQANFNENSNEVDDELVAITVEVNSLKTIVAALPEGITKEETKDKLRKAENRQYLLSKRDKVYGNFALLSLELEIVRVQKELEAMDSFIQDVTDKKATL